MLHRLLDHRREAGVALRAEADVAGVDAVLGQRFGALPHLGEQPVAVVVEVADERHPAAEGVQALPDRGHRPRRLRGVDGDPHQLGPRPGKRFHLGDGARDVRGVGVGHGLHDDGSAAADPDGADPDSGACTAGGGLQHGHGPDGRSTKHGV